SEVNAKLAFTCVHEKIPDPSAETDVLFQYARWLQKNNQIQQDETVDRTVPCAASSSSRVGKDCA
ncbi:lipoprotein, partial [Pseudomonas syringae pv. actinidiae ICMP 18804]